MSKEAKKTINFVEIVTGTFGFLVAVMASFIWFPLVGAAVAIAGLGVAIGWAANRVWTWYNTCYPIEFDRSGRAHPYLRVMTGIGRPSSGMMGGREADLIVPPPSLFRLVTGADESNPVWEEDTEERSRYRYGA